MPPELEAFEPIMSKGSPYSLEVQVADSWTATPPLVPA